MEKNSFGKVGNKKRMFGIGRGWVAAAVLGIFLGWTTFGAIATPGSGGGGGPANKVAVSGSTVEIMTGDVTNGGDSQVVTLLSGSMKTSNPADLLISVTLECALWTTTTTVGNDNQAAFAQVKVWVELDGVPVAVASDGEAERGRVVFCNRTQQMTTEMFDDEDATIRSFQSTRAANAFNWVALNVGSDPKPHSIEVKGQLDVAATSNAFAKAAVGKRTLIVEPDNLAVYAEI